jgi:hypothetical protein
MVAMTLGRPMMTYQSNMHVPLPRTRIDADLTEGDISAGLQSATHVLLYMETIKLYRILGKIVTELYRPHPSVMQGRSSAGFKATASSDIQAILNMDDDLEKYESELTPLLHWTRGQHLRAALPASAQSQAQRQSNVIQARYMDLDQLERTSAYN